GKWPGKWDAPRQSGAADGDVLEPAVEETQHFILAKLGLDELRVLRIVLTQRVLVLREPEEPVALLDGLERARRVQHAFAVDDIGVGLVRFTSDAVLPPV